MSSIVAIGSGAALGALLRWVLGTAFDRSPPWLPWLPWLPPGTFVANLLGGYLIGVAIGFFDRRPDLPPHWRLGIVTGFLGGLTTFSTFSAEVVGQLQRHRVVEAVAAVGAHLIGSVVLTMLGIATVAWLAPAVAPEGDAGEALERLAGE